jgi:hypothetical protein
MDRAPRRNTRLYGNWHVAQRNAWKAWHAGKAKSAACTRQAALALACARQAGLQHLD